MQRYDNFFTFPNISEKKWRHRDGPPPYYIRESVFFEDYFRTTFLPFMI